MRRILLIFTFLNFPQVYLSCKCCWRILCSIVHVVVWLIFASYLFCLISIIPAWSLLIIIPWAIILIIIFIIIIIIITPIIPLSLLTISSCSLVLLFTWLFFYAISCYGIHILDLRKKVYTLAKCNEHLTSWPFILVPSL